MEKKYILAIDQSTSGTKAALVGKDGKIVVSTSAEHRQYYPNPSWVEHDPLEIYQNVKRLIKELINSSGVNKDSILCLSMTNQRETVLLWDKKTSKPVYNAIVWQCRRTQDICKKLIYDGHEELITKKTGLKIDPYFSATKIRWIMENVDEARRLKKAKRLAAGTIDSWLIWKLTGGKIHSTDHTNASRTMLYNISKLDWDEELLDIFGVYKSSLPAIESSDNIFGLSSKEEVFGLKIPITGIIGDSQAALFGQRCFSAGMVKATYGTGTSILLNTGDNMVASKKGMVSALAWVLSEKPEYAIEGIIHTTGDTIKWLRDNLAIISDYEQIDNLIKDLDDTEKVYLVPAFIGLGFPYWDAEARGMITGLSRRTDRRHVIKAALESVAYQVKDALEFIKANTGIDIKELRADGGLTENDFTMQFQSDLLGLPVYRSSLKELSLMGSAYIAGLATGLWDNRSDIEKIGSKGEYFYPAKDGSLIEEKYAGWKKSVNKVLS